ncbi:MAG: glycosyltransferase family 4 protein [Pseudoalteromonas distincta]|uniref:glycosyltransferase family 4 protein n=1 Tax=Pseudoalteromonas distincta TaxID=77608 RepID=UPI003F9C15F5
MVITSISPLWFHKGDGISEVALSLHCFLQENEVNSSLLHSNNNKTKLFPMSNTTLSSMVDSNVFGFSSFSCFLKYVYCSKSDNFILHGVFQKELLLSAIILILKRKNFLIIPHSSLNITTYTNFPLYKRCVFKVISKFILKKAKAVIYLNENELNNSVYKGNNFALISNGVSTGSFKDIYEPDPKVLKLCYLGRYDINHKGLDRLIRFLSFLKVNYPDLKWSVDMFGSDSKNGKKALLDLIRSLSLENNININGPVFGEEKQECLARCDLFVLTSRYEGMPIAVLEALAQGKKCLLTKETNMLEPLLQKGFAIEFCSSDYDKTAMQLLNYMNVSQEVKKREAEEIHTYAKLNFSWSNIALKYRRVLEGKK